MKDYLFFLPLFLLSLLAASGTDAPTQSEAGIAAVDLSVTAPQTNDREKPLYRKVKGGLDIRPGYGIVLHDKHHATVYNFRKYALAHNGKQTWAVAKNKGVKGYCNCSPQEICIMGRCVPARPRRPLSPEKCKGVLVNGYCQELSRAVLKNWPTVDGVYVTQKGDDDGPGDDAPPPSDGDGPGGDGDGDDHQVCPEGCLPVNGVCKCPCTCDNGMVCLQCGSYQSCSGNCDQDPGGSGRTPPAEIQGATF